MSTALIPRNDMDFFERVSRQIMATCRFTAFFLAAALVTSANAALLITDANGNLLGASGISVGGSYYNMMFADGSCSAVFSGCDEMADFVFQDSASAVQAANAFLDQVIKAPMGATYDENPELTSGCESTAQCIMFLPWIVNTTFDRVGTVTVVNNEPSFAVDSAGAYFQLTAAFDTSERPAVWMRWTKVPEPGTGGLFLGGIAAMSLLRRRTPLHFNLIRPTDGARQNRTG